MAYLKLTKHTLQVQPALGPLVLPRQGGEHLLHEFLKQAADPRDLIGTHTLKLTDRRPDD
jgi:hypothetical protein